MCGRKREREEERERRRDRERGKLELNVKHLRGRGRKSHRVESVIMRQMVLWDTACNFNGFISNQSIFNCLIIGASTLIKKSLSPS